MPGGDVLPLYCIECDKRGISSKMMRVMHSRGEGMQVKCLAQGHPYNYETFMRLGPRKEQLALTEKMPPSCVIQQVWVHPEAWQMLLKRFPQTLMTTLCATLTALADPDTVMVEGNYAREMRELGVERGRDVLGLAKRVKELNAECEEMRIREKALAPFLKMLAQAGGAAANPAEPTATVNGHRNPELPNANMQEELIEDPETGMLVPANEFAQPQAQQRATVSLPPLPGSTGEGRPSFVRRLI
jgi:hypothetical protein